MSLDAEECSRLELSMDVFEWLCNHPDLSDWDGLGFCIAGLPKAIYRGGSVACRARF